MKSTTKNCKACSGPLSSYGKRHNRPFCSPECGAMAFREAQATRRALVAVEGTTGIRCLLCDVSLRTAGTHFVRVHGVKGSRSELQEALGLPEGFRLCAPDLRETFRALCVERGHDPSSYGFGRKVRPQAAAARASAAKATSMRSVLQQAAMANFAVVAKAHAAEVSERQSVEIVCPCGKAFTTTKGKQKKGKRCCSRVCGWRFKRTPPPSEQSIAALRASTESRRARADVVCKQCGTLFQVKPSAVGNKTTCSTECRREWVRAHVQRDQKGRVIGASLDPA